MLKGNIVNGQQKFIVIDTSLWQKLLFESNFVSHCIADYA